MSRFPQPLVIFDLDGTLVDSLPATVDCFREAVAPFLGRRPTREEVVARFGPADHRIVRDWVGPDRAEEAVALLYAGYDRVLRRLTPVPGVVDLLGDIRDGGRRLGLFTGRGRHSTGVVLEAAGLDAWFEFSVAGDEVARSKPAPDGLYRVAEAAGLTPGDAVYVGDSPLDLEAARAAGAAFLGAAWASGIEPITDPGAVVVSTVLELRGILVGR